MTQSPSPSLPADLQCRRVDLNGVGLHVAMAGPEQGPLVVLLHGFPEFWYGWRNQIGPLAAAGYRVLAPDQRGYHLSDRPARLSAYTRSALAADVAGLIEAAGRERAVVVGHDWGAAVAWWLALQRPERVEGLVVMNVPHPRVFRRALLGSSQLLRSSYMLLFQLPWLPEALLGARRRRGLLLLLRRLGRAGSFSDEDLERYRAAYASPGALTSTLAWYRAGARRWPGRLPDPPRLAAPTLIIWSRRDPLLGLPMASRSLAYCDEGQLVVVEGAGHFVALDAWPEVNRELLGWLGRVAPPRRYPS